jgi:hypothetical protein
MTAEAEHGKDGLRPLASAAGQALAEVLETVLQRLDELERRVDEIDRLEWLTIEEAADHLRATPAALRARARRGQLIGAVRVGARWLVDRRSLDAALRAATVGPDNEGGRAPRERPRPGTGG